ncbi:hypothetical protein OC861_006763 [Tilletia horrida]|nr:hypothetical protein OC861_006763 [Tilletia horrida]
MPLTRLKIPFMVEAANRTQILNSSSGSTLPVLPRNRGWQHAHRTADETLGDLINQTQPVGLFCGMNASTLHGNVAARASSLGSWQPPRYTYT